MTSERKVEVEYLTNGTGLDTGQGKIEPEYLTNAGDLATGVELREIGNPWGTQAWGLEIGSEMWWQDPGWGGRVQGSTGEESLGDGPLLLSSA